MNSTNEIPSRDTTQKYEQAVKSIMSRSPKTQKEKFEEAARELETDDSEEAFDKKLKKIAKTPPPKGDKAKATK